MKYIVLWFRLSFEAMMIVFDNLTMRYICDSDCTSFYSWGQLVHHQIDLLYSFFLLLASQVTSVGLFFLAKYVGVASNWAAERHRYFYDREKLRMEND